MGSGYISSPISLRKHIRTIVLSVPSNKMSCFVYFLLLHNLLVGSSSQETATPRYATLPKLFLEEPGPHVADVLRTEEVSAEDDVKEMDYEQEEEDDEVNRIHIPIDPIVGEEDPKQHHAPDHRFKLISLDNIVHLNPALQVSLWLFVACLVKAGECELPYFLFQFIAILLFLHPSVVSQFK
ncbi:uncharacterized protein CDAR_191831 [Caerostris darwini]|uniref:Uncharacterized protein n=1 Tax=Caerostris darwini TaxID=1538125 RepID=A0AAV4P9M1_9ARAC|nr:uncharacterized protein CDAR_191831 [Caerostris darwini]